MSSTEKIKERMAALRHDVEAALERAEKAEAASKKLEQLILEKEQEITSLTHRLGLTQTDLDKAEEKIQTYKAREDEGSQSVSERDNLLRKIQLLEEELDAAEKNVKETTEKLRQVDVKAEHFQRSVTVVERERDEWETKYETVLAQYEKTKHELEEFERSMNDI